MTTLLPQIPVKTLVVHKTEDHIASIEAGRYIATSMPNATLVELEGADHIYFVESAALLSAIIQFCQEETADSELDTWLAIILYISTKATKLSSRDLQTYITSYNPRRILQADGEVITLFDSPSRALQCALMLRDNAKQAAVSVSLHVGACHVVTGKPLESVLATARQVVAFTDPGEIIVTGTLHDILAGSAFEFAERNVGTAPSSPSNIRLYTLI
jgi:hypothetical protein